MVKPKFRRPAPDEQHVLEHLTVRLIAPHERPRYQALMEERNCSGLTSWPRWVARG